MPSTFSPSLKIELIANGEQAGTWGQTTNNNLGTLIEQAIAGVDTIDITGASTYTLSNYNGISDEARNAAIIFTGTLSANCAVTTPAVEKLYIISNQTTGGYYVTVSTGSGNTVAIGSNTNQLIYCDGTNYNTAVSNINNVVGDLTVTGSIFLGGNLTSTTGNLTLNAYSNVVNMGNNTGALIAPIGTTAQRPTALVNGMVRWNTTTSAYEVYTGSIWINLLTSNYTVSYLIIAGGGGGASSVGNVIGGGGGAGGYLAGTNTFSTGSTYTITVGSGGGSNAQGANSSIVEFATAIGGGGGGGVGAGGSGGSGGGSSGTGTVGQGNNGGAQYNSGGGGGGGAGTVGGTANTSGGGAGGSGLASSITGSSVTRAGGGGGGGSGFSGQPNGGAGGSGGGGAGAGGYSYPTAGTPNTGGGGGAGGWNGVDTAGANGGSGVVILSIPTASYSGVTSGSPTVSTSGANTILQYTSSGTYVA